MNSLVPRSGGFIAMQDFEELWDCDKILVCAKVITMLPQYAQVEDMIGREESEAREVYAYNQNPWHRRANIVRDTVLRISMMLRFNLRGVK